MYYFEECHQDDGSMLACVVGVLVWRAVSRGDDSAIVECDIPAPRCQPLRPVRVKSVTLGSGGGAMTHAGCKGVNKILW